MKVSEFKAQLANIPEHHPEAVDRLVIQWLREGAKDMGVHTEHIMGKVMDVAATLMEV